MIQEMVRGYVNEGGEGGHFPLNENWSWDGDESKVIGEDGSNWQGGHGSIFGAGGGGGFMAVEGGSTGHCWRWWRWVILAADAVESVVTCMAKNKSRRHEQKTTHSNRIG